MRMIDEGKKELIRDTALKMIVSDGFKGMSMQKLAKAAGVSPATLYIYYADRQDMLNQLYVYVFNSSNQAALVGFNAQLNYHDGMRVLWLNRFRYFVANPSHALFIEQFVNSPLIKAAADLEDESYSTNMQQFYANAKANNQVRELPVEVYWSLAFAPLYQLIKFHVQKGPHPANRKGVSEQEVLQCLQLVLKALQP